MPQRVEHDDPAEHVGDDPPGQPVRRRRRARSASRRRTPPPASRAGSRRTGAAKTPRPPRPPASSGSPTATSTSSRTSDAEAAAGAEDRAGEHDAERLGGDRHGKPGGSERRDETEGGDDAGEGGDQGEVTGAWSGERGHGESTASWPELPRPIAVQSRPSEAVAEGVAGLEGALAQPVREPAHPLLRRAVRPGVRVDPARRLALDPVVADRARPRRAPRLMSSWVRSRMYGSPLASSALGGVLGPHAGVAVGLQLEPDRVAGRALLGAHLAHACRAGPGRGGRTRGRARRPRRTGRPWRRAAPRACP